MSEALNGKLSFCPVKDNWEKHAPEVQKLIEGMNSLEVNMLSLATHLSHLSKLDFIGKQLVDLNQSLTGVKDDLIGAATGKQQVPVDVVEKLNAQVEKSNDRVSRIMGTVIIVLIVVIATLLTGEKWGMIKDLVH